MRNNKNIPQQRALHLLAICQKFEELHEPSTIQQALLQSCRYATLYMEETAEEAYPSNVIEATHSVCALIDYLFTEVQSSIFDSTAFNMADHKMFKALQEEFHLDEKADEIIEGQPKDDSTDPHYRNIVDVTSDQGSLIDEGCLWHKRGPKLVLVDEDEYITHDLDLNKFKIAY